MPAFTVVITLFNDEPQLVRCLDALCMQTCQDWEAIIVADGPHPRARIIQEEMARRDTPGRTFYYELVRAPGCYGNLSRRFGLQRARGENICWIGHDCLLYPTYLETHLQQLQEPCLSLVRVNYWRADGEHLHWFGPTPWLPVEKLTHPGTVDLTSMAAPTAVARKADAFCSADRRLYGADFAAFKRIRAHVPVRISQHVCAAHF